MEGDLFDTLVPVITMLIGLVAGMVVSFYAKAKAAAEATSNKLDDLPFDFIDAVVDRITKAKAEDPKTPLGSGPASP